MSGERIAKLIARAGVCSRREAEKLIADGRVTLDGQKVDSPALNVADVSRIAVDGKRLKAPNTINLWKYHKPRGVISTRKDTHNRPTIYDDIPQEHGHLVNIGRLDAESEGLLLFTNNGDFARALTLPSSNIERIYEVTVSGEIPGDMSTKVHKGLTVEGIRYRPSKCKIVKKLKNDQTLLTFTLTEGKNREIRNICAFFNLRVKKLKRITYGGISLGNLPKSEFREVAQNELTPRIRQILDKCQPS